IITYIMTQVDVKCYCQLYQKNLYAYKNSIFLFLAFSCYLRDMESAFLKLKGCLFYEKHSYR
ncbi:TPA: hypothetical protein ACQPFQ_000571, partial [Streptococcus pyogenes]